MYFHRMVDLLVSLFYSFGTDCVDNMADLHSDSRIAPKHHQENAQVCFNPPESHRGFVYNIYVNVSIVFHTKQASTNFYHFLSDMHCKNP